MNTPPGQDEEFESALRARRRLVPRFDVDDDAEPSPELDRIVIGRARDALRAGRIAASPAQATDSPLRPAARERHFRGPRWAVPLALAATVLLSFTLVMQLDPARNDAVLAPREGATLAAQEESVAPTAQAAAAADAATPERSAVPLADRAMPAAPDAAPPPPVPAPPPAAALAVPPAPPVAAREATEFAANEAANAMAAAPRESESRREADAAFDAASAAAAPSAAKSAAAGSPAQARARGTAAAAADAAAGADAIAADARRDTADQDPRAWLERIEQLRRAGELDAARVQLAEFRRRHPEVALPPALRDLR